MTPKIKSLLLGVSLRWRVSDDGIGQTSDPKRRKIFTEALERLTIEDDGLEPDTLSSMLDEPEAVVEWLIDNPKATVHLGYWRVAVWALDFKTVDFERDDWPFPLDGAIEDFSKTKSAGGWEAVWCLD